MVPGTRARWFAHADNAVSALTVALVARRGIELVAVGRSGRWSRNQLTELRRRNAAAGIGDHGVVCVVPMYLEQDIAADTVRFWHRLAEQAPIDQILFVTTAKEQPSDGPSTREVVEGELTALGAQARRLRLLHCDEVTRFRAAQLNLAVEHARREREPGDAEQTQIWIGVYNADSRPQASTFTELADRARAEPGTRIFQQLADYVVPQRPGAGRVAVGNAILQTWWTRSHYWARSTRGGRGRSWWAATAPYSTFGHGEFVRVDFLDAIGGFPDFAYADGLLLGWICRLRAEPIGLLASRDRAEVPRTGPDLFTQQTAWMHGLLNFNTTVSWCRERGHLRLTASEVAALRTTQAVIPVVWGLSSAAVVVGIAAVVQRIASRGATVGDLARLAGLVSYPAVPGLLPGADGHRRHRLGARLVGAAVSWPIEGLAFWPALVRHVRRVQQAPAKTPR